MVQSLNIFQGQLYVLHLLSLQQADKLVRLQKVVHGRLWLFPHLAGMQGVTACQEYPKRHVMACDAPAGAIRINSINPHICIFFTLTSTTITDLCVCECILTVASSCCSHPVQLFSLPPNTQRNNTVCLSKKSLACE